MTISSSRRLIAVAPLVTVVLALTGCSDSDRIADPSPTPSETLPARTIHQYASEISRLDLTRGIRILLDCPIARDPFELLNCDLATSNMTSQAGQLVLAMAVGSFDPPAEVKDLVGETAVDAEALSKAAEAVGGDIGNGIKDPNCWNVDNQQRCASQLDELDTALTAVQDDLNAWKPFMS